MKWFKIGKGVCQGCILSACLFNFYAEYIMWNARLDEPQTGIKIAKRNINNLKEADNTTLIAESKEDLNSPLMRVKEESEKAHLKSNIQKTKIMASSYFPWLQKHCGWWLQLWKWKTLSPWKKSYDKPSQHIKKQKHHFADKGPYSQS